MTMLAGHSVRRRRVGVVTLADGDGVWWRVGEVTLAMGDCHKLLTCFASFNSSGLSQVLFVLYVRLNFVNF